MWCYNFCNPIIMKFILYIMFMSNGGKCKNITYAIIEMHSS